MLAHSVPKDQRPNVLKQATKIRYCLLQAKEYRDAAEGASLATKPLLLYYSVMSLAFSARLGAALKASQAARCTSMRPVITPA